MQSPGPSSPTASGSLSSRRPSTAVRQRPSMTPGGPRKPTRKSSYSVLASPPPPLTPRSPPRVEERESDENEHEAREQLPSYSQSQSDTHPRLSVSASPPPMDMSFSQDPARPSSVISSGYNASSPSSSRADTPASFISPQASSASASVSLPGPSSISIVSKLNHPEAETSISSASPPRANTPASFISPRVSTASSSTPNPSDEATNESEEQVSQDTSMPMLNISLPPSPPTRSNASIVDEEDDGESGLAYLQPSPLFESPEPSSLTTISSLSRPAPRMDDSLFACLLTTSNAPSPIPPPSAPTLPPEKPPLPSNTAPQTSPTPPIPSSSHTHLPTQPSNFISTPPSRPTIASQAPLSSQTSSRPEPPLVRPNPPFAPVRQGTPAPSLTSSSYTPLPIPPPPDFSSLSTLHSIGKKALTLSTAQWTLTSSELQQLVSRAIRASAEPTSIRLLPLDVLDRELLEEETRLEGEVQAKQARYRFVVMRRGMVLQSLNASLSTGASSTSTATFANAASSASSSPVSTTFPSNIPTVSSAHSDQLSTLCALSASLDALALELLEAQSQLSDLRALRALHGASALAVALRKLNGSYARRTRELSQLKEKLAQVEAERDDAWRVAEELAKEVDEIDGEYDDEEDVTEDMTMELTEEVVNGTRAVAAPATLTRASRIGIRLRVPGVGPRIVTSGSLARSPRSPLRKSAVDSGEADSPGIQTEQKEGEPVVDDTEATAAEQSSAPPVATRQRSNSAASRVSAARTRSIRASKASLRIPRELLVGAPSNASGSRPLSSYSQRSTRSGSGLVRTRSRSKGGAGAGSASTPASPVDSPASPSPGGEQSQQSKIPEVPKIPMELLNAGVDRVFSPVNTTPSSTFPTVPLHVPPMPPKAEKPSPTGSNDASFLDLATRPSSRAGTREADPVGGAVVRDERGVEAETLRRSLENVASQNKTSDEIEAEEEVADIIDSYDNPTNDDDGKAPVDADRTRPGTAGVDQIEAVSVSENIADMSQAGHGLPNPFSPTSPSPSRASLPLFADTGSSASPISATSAFAAKPRPANLHHSLSSGLPQPPRIRDRDRPPPDSPVDATYPGEDEEDAEILGSFADAYSYAYGTQSFPSRGRGQQTQSMLPVPFPSRMASDGDVNDLSDRGRVLHHVASYTGSFGVPPSVPNSAPVTGSGSCVSTIQDQPKRIAKSPLSPSTREAYPFALARRPARPASDGTIANPGTEGGTGESPVSAAATATSPLTDSDGTRTTFGGKPAKQRPTSMPISVISPIDGNDGDKSWGYF